MAAERNARAVDPPRLIVAITEAPGIRWGVRLLELLHPTPVQTHLILGEGADRAIAAQTGRDPAAVCRLAGSVYHPRNQAAAVSSGSFVTAGLVVAPCSTNALGAIALGLASNLVNRAADVAIKERRRVALLVAEERLTPMNQESVRRLAGLATVLQLPALGPAGDDGRARMDHLLTAVLAEFGLDAFLAAPAREVNGVQTTGRPPG